MRCYMRVSELIREITTEGWTATICPGGHYRATHPQAKSPVYFPATPGDWRWHANVRRDLRHALPPEPKPARTIEPQPRRRRRPPSTHRPAPVRAYPEGPMTMHMIAGPERREYPAEPPQRRLAGGPAGFRSCLDRS
jgi:hypothetical protein